MFLKSWKLNLVVVVAVSLMPMWRETIVPKWEVQFVYSDGEFVANQPVVQTWKNDSLEFWRLGEHSAEVHTNENGAVTFPAREIWVSPMVKFLSIVRDLVVRINPHASFGNTSHVSCPYVMGCYADYRDGNELQKIIIVER